MRFAPSTLASKLGTQTDHGFIVGSGTTTALTALTVGTNGQVLIGSTGADPVFATITSTGSTLTFTTSAGGLNVDVSSPLVVSYGGTGGSSLTVNSILTGNGTSPIQSNIVLIDSLGKF
jgi:hypothetical protein